MQTPEDLIGKKLAGKLVITDFIGEGAMGIVYRGFDEEARRPVAVKVLQPALAVHAELVARFHREGAAARRVDHASTVRFLGRGEDAGVHYLVMELLDGKSLGDLLAIERRLAPARAARLMAQIAGALEVAHHRGVVHRDLKPDNVMVLGRPDDALGEHVKLLDFGIAKRMPSMASLPSAVEDSFPSEDLTACGALVGTPEYMAPEQCRAREVDARTDVYACGVMLFRMVTGEVPFTADHLLEVCQLHLGEPPRAPSSLAPDLPATLEAVILKALEKAPERRHGSAAELRGELEAVLASLVASDTEATESEIPASSVDPLARTADTSAPLATPGEATAPSRSGVQVASPWRREAAVVATCVAFGAGMASLLLGLGALLHS